MRENFVITGKEDGKQYWISRSMAVTGIVFSVDENGEIYFLVQKRGPGCPDFVGYWCNSCGYLGWDETRVEAVTREVGEEMGLDLSKIPDDHIIEWCTQDDPKENVRQNVTTRFLIPVSMKMLKDSLMEDYNTESRGGEKDEVAEIRIISEHEIDKFRWAWNHGQLLKDAVRYLTSNEYE